MVRGFRCWLGREGKLENGAILHLQYAAPERRAAGAGSDRQRNMQLKARGNAHARREEAVMGVYRNGARNLGDFLFLSWSSFFRFFFFFSFFLLQFIVPPVMGPSHLCNGLAAAARPPGAGAGPSFPPHPTYPKPLSCNSCEIRRRANSETQLCPSENDPVGCRQGVQPVQLCGVQRSPAPPPFPHQKPPRSSSDVEEAPLPV